MDGHWSVRSITRSLLPVLLVLTALELVGGLALGSFETTLLDNPSLLVLVPVMIGTAGNLGSILSARLSTTFHLGTLSFAPDDETLVGNALATALLGLTVYPVVGAGGWAVAALAGSPGLGLGTVVGIALASGLVLVALVVAISLAATYAAYRFELDPDDVVIPVVTNVSDVLGLLVLFAVVQVVV